ncbi:terpene synthase 10-like [Ananas comosus]|uniref:Terpene synthase 10-like n=1 Tax=Ananas comosus TaxID=4615 RepID=A0A6P5G5A2_ANACO|nr:terpene synthase 10-like [Ananas comosus]
MVLLHLASPSPAPFIVLTSPDRWLRRELPTVQSPIDGLSFPQRRGVRACAMRRSANYRPSLWHNKYMQSLTSTDIIERDAKRLDVLKEEVGRMIDEETVVVDKLELIDALQQLGIAYHVEKEIKHALDSIFSKLDDIRMETKGNAYIIALLFRLLRGHGFGVSQDIFDQFKDEKGSFKFNLSNQIISLLSLYETSYLAVEGEDTLNEARDFTIRHLNNFLLNSLDDNYKLRDYVARALEQPLHWRMERLHTRWFIDAYEKEEEMRPLLLEFAKLDFNVVQNTYKRELKEVSRWWSNLGLWEKLSFSRDRLAENYLWPVGWAFEPKNSTFRLAQTKANCLITAIDDIYDVYGSLDELELFTEAVDRWDALDIKQLPEYMKVCFLALFNTTNNTAYETMREKGLNILPYLKRAWTDLCKAYLVEAKWYNKNYIPTLEEYLQNGWLSISGHVILSYAYCLVPDLTQHDLDLFQNYPEIMQWSSMLLRLYNDLGTSKPEHQRGDVAKSIHCCMHHEGITEAAARERIKELIYDCWKKLNGARQMDSTFNENFADIAMNVPRAAHSFYFHGDGYGSPEGETKDRIISLLIDPVQI